MSPRPRPRSGMARVAAILVAALAGGMLVAACAGAPFDPTGPCTADGSAPGAYPELESLVPKTYNGAAPVQLDSGRACTQEGLGTLATHGIKEVRFAGATWSTGTDSGISLAVFQEMGGSVLDRTSMTEFYEAGARAGKNVTSVDVSDVDHDGSPARRIDVLNGESYQTILVWNADDHVAVTLVASFIREIQTKDAHEKVVQQAIETWPDVGTGG